MVMKQSALWEEKRRRCNRHWVVEVGPQCARTNTWTTRAVPKTPVFFLVEDRPQGQPPGTTGCQLPTAANRQPPTTNRHQPPTANHQPLPTALAEPFFSGLRGDSVSGRRLALCGRPSVQGGVWDSLLCRLSPPPPPPPPEARHRPRLGTARSVTVAPPRSCTAPGVVSLAQARLGRAPRPEHATGAKDRTQRRSPGRLYTPVMAIVPPPPAPRPMHSGGVPG